MSEDYTPCLHLKGGGDGQLELGLVCYVLVEILARGARLERFDLWQRRGVPLMPRSEGLSMRMGWKMLRRVKIERKLESAASRRSLVNLI